MPPMAVDVIREQPRFAHSLFVFPAARGTGHFTSYRDGKRALDAATGPLPQWGLHDLRRTARSLMSRVGVSFEHAERVLGHAQGGVAGVYNRHEYREEKAQALTALAGLLANILRPEAPKVVNLRG